MAALAEEDAMCLTTSSSSRRPSEPFPLSSPSPGSSDALAVDAADVALVVFPVTPFLLRRKACLALLVLASAVLLFAVGEASFALFGSALLARAVRGARVGTEVTLLGFMPGSKGGVLGIRVGLTVASGVARIAVVAGSAVVGATVVTTVDGWDTSSALNTALLADSILRAWPDLA